MEITYLGHSSFKIKGKNITLITDPYDSNAVGLKYPKTEGDIVTVSHQHDDHNATDQVTGVRKIITGPGEYEIAGVSIIGVASFHDNQNGIERGKNTIYVIEMEGFRLVHLGDLGHKLSDSQLEDIGEVDVVFIPVGGKYTINSVEATEVARQIEASFVIPMHYNTAGLDPKTFSELESVDEFVKQVSLPTESTAKFVLKEPLLEGEQKIVLLERK